MCQIEQVATLDAIERHWSIAQVLDANEALDLAADVDTWRRGPPAKKDQPNG